MSFNEELVFTGVNHPSYLFSNIVEINHFYEKKIYFLDDIFWPKIEFLR